MLKRLKNFFNSFAALIVAFFALFIPAIAQNESFGATTFDEFVAGITSRSTSLTFISETDSDVVVCYRTRAVDSLSVSEFRRVFRVAPLAQITTQTFDDFFTRLINYDNSGRWEILRDYIQTNTTAQTVFRVRRTGDENHYYDVYAVGLFDGKIVGIHVLSLET